jgi:acetyl-CoA carboxylase carboxyl transferase subunit alpha
VWPNGLRFEEPILELERRIGEIERLADSKGLSAQQELERLRATVTDVKRKVYQNLSAWEKVQVARHPQRPITRDFIRLMVTDFIELHGDGLFRDDQAVVCGLATIGGRRFMLIGHQKGKTTKEKVACYFGCPHPEGYRKALRFMKLAERFRLPVVCLIDTPGAYPGIGAEERGQAHSIAVNLREMARLRQPIICIVTGEGCSGGALGIGLGDYVGILEHAYYSVISPEGCAAILFRTSARAAEAAEALRLTPRQLLDLGLVDEVLPEPPGGAHRDHRATADVLKDAILRQHDLLAALPLDELVDRRYYKFRRIGVFTNGSAARQETPRGT